MQPSTRQSSDALRTQSRSAGCSQMSEHRVEARRSTHQQPPNSAAVTTAFGEGLTVLMEVWTGAAAAELMTLQNVKSRESPVSLCSCARQSLGVLQENNTQGALCRQSQFTVFGPDRSSETKTENYNRTNGQFVFGNSTLLCCSEPCSDSQLSLKRLESKLSRNQGNHGVTLGVTSRGKHGSSGILLQPSIVSMSLPFIPFLESFLSFH